MADLDHSSKGDIALNLVWKSDPHLQSSGWRSTSEPVFNDDGTIDCEQSQITKVYAGIYDQFTGALLMDNGDGWNCSDHAGVVNHVPAGGGRKLVCLARDVDGNTIYRGEKSDITVIADVTAHDATPVRIEMSPFTSDPLGLEDGAETTADSPEFQCRQVDNAAAYRFQVATDQDFATVVVDETSATYTFTPSPFTNSATYYWRVCPIDMHGSEGAWSAPRALQLSLPPMISTLDATAVTPNSAVLNGVVNPRDLQTTYYFEYGTTTDYGATTESDYAGAGAADVPVSATLQAMVTETTYHFRLVAINRAGKAFGPDHQFSTGDATSQMVVETQPKANAKYVGLDSLIFVRFSDPINEDRLTADSFTISTAGDGSGRIDGNYTCDGMTATFTPTAPLNADTTYYVTLTTDFEDAAGNPLDSNYSWSFKTTEFMPPSVTAVYPYESARGVQVLPTITAAFDEPVSGDTLNSTTFLVNDGEDNIAGTVAYDEAAMTAFFTPDANLLCDRTYTVTITAGVKDLAGNPLAAEKIWQFETADNCGGQVLAGPARSMVLKADGTLWAWGNNNYGLLGDGSTDPKPKTTPTQIGTDADWAEVSSGDSHTLALKTDGTLWAWGRNGREGRLGDGTNIERHTPTQIGTDADWASVSAGATHSMAVKTDGTRWAWGENYSGEYGDGTTGWSGTPKQIGSAADWMVVETGKMHTVAVKTDGSLWAWGYNGSGRLGDGSTEPRTTPVPIGTDTDWATAYAGYDRTFALKTDGTLWGWGNNASGWFGDGTTSEILRPARIGNDSDWVAIGDGGACFLKADGTLWTWKSSAPVPLGDGAQRGSLVQIGTDADWAQVSTSGHTVAMKSNGTLWGWGANGAYQLGDGTNEDKTVPTPMVVDTRWKAASAGGYFTIALKADGTLWAWGISGPSRIGDGTTDTKTVPVPIGTDRDWANVFAGESKSFALKTDGTLWTWEGQQDILPVQIGTDTDWEQVSSGSGHTLALKTDGTLWAWGGNTYGQVGDGTTDDIASPVQIGVDADWVAISAGRYHSLALKANGTLWAWGYDYDAQLGNGKRVMDMDFKNYITKPIKIGNDNNWMDVSAGFQHSLGLKEDGTLWAWGGNTLFLDNYVGWTNGFSDKPAQIGVDTDWTVIHAAYLNTIITKTDNTIWSWGITTGSGKIEGWETGDQTGDTSIGSSHNWVKVSSGWAHAVALQKDGTLWAWGTRPLGDGTNNDNMTPPKRINYFTIY